MFLTSTNSTGSWGVVLEAADDACWLYLCRITDDTTKISDAIHIASGPAQFAATDVALEWNRMGSKAALLITGQVWAVFDTVSQGKYGGDYQPEHTSSVPSNIAAEFSEY